MEGSQEKLTNNNNNNNDKDDNNDDDGDGDDDDDDDYEQCDNVVKKIPNNPHLYDVHRVKLPSSSKAGFHVRFFFSL